MKLFDDIRFAKATIVAFFAAAALLFIRWIPDDAYISFRYARNLADGAGLVFNAGERVEGVSNPLWTVALALLTKTGLETATTAVVLSLLFALASVLLTFRLFDLVLAAGTRPPDERRRFVGLRISLAVGLTVLLPMIFYATSGMETHAELVFLLAGAILHLEARSRESKSLLVASQFSLLVVALLRPEGIMFLLLGAGFVSFDALKHKHGARCQTGAWIAVTAPLILYLVALAGKSAYYGAVLPNTYFAKPGVGVGYLAPLARGFRYLARFFLVSGLVVLLPACAIAFADARRRRACVFIASFVAAQVAFIVLVGGDVLRFHRFTVPFAPFLLAIALVGFVRLEAALRLRSRRPAVGVAVICVAVIASLNGGRVVLAKKKYCQHDWMHAQAHRRIGAFLRDALPENAAIVVNEVGAMAYESGLVTHDMLGLTDSTVSRILYQSLRRYGEAENSWSVPQIVDYLMSKDPDCVVVPAYGEANPSTHEPVVGLMHPIWEGLFTHAELVRRYRCALCLQINDRKYLYFYLRKDNGAHDNEGYPPAEPLPIHMLSSAPCISLCDHRGNP
jgi:hypothetical protein